MRTVSDDVMIDVLKLISSIDDHDNKSKAKEIKNDDQQKVEGHAGGSRVAPSIDDDFRYVARIIWGRGDARKGCPLYPQKRTFSEAA